MDFFAYGYDGLNFGFKREAAGSRDDLFTRYSAALRAGALRGVAILNCVSSHDDGSPYDVNRADPFGAGTLFARRSRSSLARSLAAKMIGRARFAMLSPQRQHGQLNTISVTEH